MPIELNTLPAPAATNKTAHLGRRALLGVGLLAIMTMASGGLIYSTIEPGEAIASDADAARRLALLSKVTSWSLEPRIDALRATTVPPDVLLVFEADVIAKLDVSAVRNLLEERDRTDETARQLLVAALSLSQSAQLDGLLVRGLDGIFLDARSAMQTALAAGSRAINDLAGKIVLLANQARLYNPDFILILHNAAELTADPRIARVIDGVAQDNLLYGLDGPGVANSANEVAVALHDLNRVKRSRRPVFIAEILPAGAEGARAIARRKLAELGFVARIAEPKKPS